MMFNKSNHIALFIPTLSGGGAERVFLELAKEFNSLGHEIDLVVKERTGELLHSVPKDVKIIDLNASRMLNTLLPLRKYLKEKSPDLLIAGLELPNVMAVLAHKISGSQAVLVLTFHSMISHMFNRSFKRCVEKSFARLLFPFANRYVAVSKGVAQDIAEFYGLPSIKIDVIYNPVPIQEIQEFSKEPINHPFFDKGIPVILGIGRLVHGKNFELLIDVFAHLLKNHKAKLIILGEGEMRKDLEAQVEKMHLKDDIDLIGFVKNPYPYLKKADVFVHSSFSEGFGLVIAEALVIGCPVVAFNSAGGISEILDHGRYGEVVPVGDMNLMAEAIFVAIGKEKQTLPDDWFAQYDPKNVALKFLKLIKKETLNG